MARLMRFEDTPGLFGNEGGCATYCNLTCEWCGTNYEGRENKEGEPLSSSEAIEWVDFGGIQVAECCFEAVERAVLLLIQDIIPWYTRILEKQKGVLREREDMLEKLKGALEENRSN